MQSLREINIIEKNINITDEMIVKLRRVGWTVQQISKEYRKTQKRKGIKITILEAQKYVEPIIFEYQTNLMKT